MNLIGDSVRIGAGEVDLVDDRHDRQILFQRQVHVGHGLSFDALRGVDHEQCTLAGCKAPAHLVGEVNVARGIDQVQFVGLAVTRRVTHADGARLDRDPLLALQVHGIEKLRLHLPAGDGLGLFQQTVSERRFAVVNMRNDGEVANP